MCVREGGIVCVRERCREGVVCMCVRERGVV